MARDVYSLIRDELGVDSVESVRNTVVSAGVAGVQLWKQDPQRVAFVVVNLSANTVLISPGADVSATSGIALNPNGGSVTMLWRDDLHLPALEWFVIAPAGVSAIMAHAVRIADTPGKDSAL